MLYINIVDPDEMADYEPSHLDLQCLQIQLLLSFALYRKLPKFPDTNIFAVLKLPKIQTKRPNLGLFCQNGAKGIANSEDPDQTAPLGAV